MMVWAAEWYSNNKLDGIRTHFIHRNCLPVMFKTRKLCREWIDIHYGYIKTRKDLRDEPHGWRLPRAVEVKLVKDK